MRKGQVMSEEQKRKISEAKRRTMDLEAAGYRVVRVWEHEINAGDFSKAEKVARDV